MKEHNLIRIVANFYTNEFGDSSRFNSQLSAAPPSVCRLCHRRVYVSCFYIWVASQSSSHRLHRMLCNLVWDFRSWNSSYRRAWPIKRLRKIRRHETHVCCLEIVHAKNLYFGFFTAKRPKGEWKQLREKTEEMRNERCSFTHSSDAEFQFPYKQIVSGLERRD